ncbi:type II secretion system F family protein [Paraburkholderia lycopersici]|uniref:Tight adherence protein C n=1 Tax=Paraburkholderia lycopersici TaxID=416944 RepID=A0A1G6W2L7_9BURK|nr:type II secretion system F family protein [Paraburkholderia lycopersici]SDD59296.1 tight adherence protein C [Paraburkholderia lycopersici]
MNAMPVDLLVNLFMLLALLGALVLWWALNRGGYRGRIAERVRQVGVNAARGADSSSEDTPGKGFAIASRFMAPLIRFGERMPLFTSEQRLKLAQDLVKAGFRGSSAVPTLIAAKFVSGLVWAALVVLYVADLFALGHVLPIRMLMMFAAFMFGMIVPEYALDIYSRRRRKQILAYFPDALDLFVICTNAGNSLGVGLRRVAQEMALICPALASEFALTADELHLSGDGARALQAMADRVDVAPVRALISTLIQSMRYGTPISQALRTLSRIERTAHIVRIEETAAKLAPKMVVPMMLFILPAVIAISAGPAIMQLATSLKHLT